jgi:hypothetical protein
MAAALVDYGRSFSIEPKAENVEDFENFPGEGVHGKIDGQDIYIGSKRIALRASCETGETKLHSIATNFLLRCIPREKVTPRILLPFLFLYTKFVKKMFSWFLRSSDY